MLDERIVIVHALTNKEYLSEVVKLPDGCMLDRFCSFMLPKLKEMYSKGHEITEESLKHYLGDEYFFAGDLRSTLKYDPLDAKLALDIVKENWKQSKLVDMGSYIMNHVKDKSEDVSEFIQQEMDELVDVDEEKATMTSIIHELEEDIKEKQKNQTTGILRTGWKEFDQLLGLEMQKFVLVSAEKKVGKTRWMIDLIKRLLKYNDLSVHWFTFEMGYLELIRLFISAEVMLSEPEIAQKVNLLTEEQAKKIFEATDAFKQMDIEFVTEPMNIYKLCSRFRRFCAKRPGRKNVLVIDNQGYIVPHTREPNKNDDDIARAIRGLRDEQNALIFLIHHLTKAAANEKNIERGYEPRLSDVRGSARSVDFCNVCLLLHRPGFYEDLMAQLALENEESEMKILEQLFLVIVGLNRSGTAPVQIRLKHRLKYSKFDNF